MYHSVICFFASLYFALTDDGWAVFVNYFEPDCTTYRSSPYGFPAGDNGPQASALTDGASSQVVNIYSQYDDPAHATTCLETNVYKQIPIAVADAGEYTFRYDGESPPAEFAGDKVNAFVKVFANDFSAVLGDWTFSSSPGAQRIDVTITEAMEGGWLQVGFNNYAYAYENSGMYYDNVVFDVYVEPPPSEDSIPTISAWGTMLLLLLIGALGAAALVRRTV